MNLLKTLCGLLLLTALAAGCSPAPQQSSDPGVQDITPGEQSIIQPPAQRTQQSNIQERKL